MRIAIKLGIIIALAAISQQALRGIAYERSLNGGAPILRHGAPSPEYIQHRYAEYKAAESDDF